MKIERTKNAVRNIYWGTLNKVIGIVLPFIVRTVLLQKLGNEYLGLNSLFSSILQILSVAELGIGNAIVFSMYKPIAEDDTATINAILNFYKKTYHFIGTVVLGFGILCVPFLSKLISGDAPADINIYILYLIYLFNTVISYFMFSYKQSILLAFQRNDLDNKIQSAINLLLYVFQIVLLLVKPCYYTYVILIPLSTIAINIFRSICVNKNFPQFKCEGQISNNFKHDLFKRVSGMMLYKISYVFRNSFDSIVISTFLGLVVLAQYQNYYYIMNSVAGFLSVIATSITAGIGNSMNVDSPSKNKQNYMTFNLIFTWIAGWCCVCFMCLYQDFITLWVGETNRLSNVLVVLICIYFYLLQIGNVCAVYREAAGLWWEDRFRPIVESFANLLLNFVLVAFWGVVGVVVATIVSILCINIPWAMHILFKNYFKEHAVPMLFLVAKLSLEVAMVCVCSTFLICLIDKVISILLVRLIVKFLLCCIIPNVFFAILFQRRSEYKDVISLIKRIFNKKFIKQVS